MTTEPPRPIAGRLPGAWTALVTPFAGDGLDLDILRALIAHQLAAGIAGLVVGSPTGEVAALTDAEYRAVVRATVEAAGGRVPVMAGVGTGTTATTLTRGCLAHELGADLVLVPPPAGTRATPRGLIAHLEAIAAATPLPIVLHDAPGPAGSGFEPDTVIRLSRDPGIVGMVDASGDVARAGWIARHASPGFALLAGDDALTLPIMSVGGVGVVSVIGNVAPATVASLVATGLRGEFAEARRRQLALVDLNRALTAEPDPVPVKAAAALLGYGTGAVRLPLTPATSSTIETLNRTLRTVEETAAALRVTRPEPRPTI